MCVCSKKCTLALWSFSSSVSLTVLYEFLCLRHVTVQWNSWKRNSNMEFDDCRLYIVLWIMYGMEGWLFNTMPDWNVISTRHHSLHRWSKHYHLCAAEKDIDHSITYAYLYPFIRMQEPFILDKITQLDLNLLNQIPLLIHS